MQRLAPILVAAMLAMAPLGAHAADLIVWWDKGFYAQEDEAIAEVVAAFEQKTGKHAELAHFPEEELSRNIEAALDAGRPPDIAYGLWIPENIGQWALDDRLIDLTDVIGSFANMFDADALDSVALVNGRSGQRAAYGLPVGRSSNHIHVWKSLLEQAGFTLADIPKDWDGFWSFWCDQAQPAVRQATGRDDIWGVGLAMGAESDAWYEFNQFVAAYQADWVTPDGRLVIDDPKIRQTLVKVVDYYTAIYRKGCAPPDTVEWVSWGNNEAFLAQRVVLTPNLTLSIPNALKREHPEDYYENTATIEWPLGPGGEPFPIFGEVYPAVVFKDGDNVATAKEFVRFLLEEGWLAHYLDFSGERVLPPMAKLVDQPFWLDPSDRHRMAAAIQVTSRPLLHNYAAASGNWRHERVDAEFVWAKAVHRVAAEGISPEQAVDEAIARIKQILAE
jgi:multiple sugar transport system substrate-binding protein